METWQVIAILALVAVYFIFFNNPVNEQPPLKSTGLNCTNNTECMSGNCSAGMCAPSNLNGSCIVDIDCKIGLCKSGICSQSEIGEACNKNEDCKEGGACLNQKCIQSNILGI
ncbi:MAG: hypothetical protein V1678_03705, partial [Candidatus Aenigmatarchaeota archaeon]